MIRKNGNEIDEITALGHVIAYVRKGTRLVWEAIRSCFGKGFWINGKPWSNTDAWKN